jgi:hypothetical protein
MKTIILLAIGIIIGWSYKPAFADNVINKSKEILAGALNYVKALFKNKEKM